MELLSVIFLFILGILLTVKGGDLFVDAATWIAKASGIPKLIIGATVVSLATTLPELIVSCLAAGEGMVDMSIGNAVGSVNANVGLIMAIAFIFMARDIKRRDYLKKTIMLLVAAGAITVCGFTGRVTLAFSAVLIVVFALFMFDNVREAKIVRAERGDEPKDQTLFTRRVVSQNIGKFVIGLAFIIIGAQLLVEKGSELARFFGVSERVIGITLVAVGTSLPELITTVTAIIKKQSSLSFGNVIGANIIDLTLIMPLSSLVAGKALPISEVAARVDIPACLVLCALALIPAVITEKFKKWQGYLILTLYVGYMVVSCIM